MKSLYCDDAKDCTSASGSIVNCFLPESAFCVQEKRKQRLANAAIPRHFLEKRCIIMNIFMDEGSVAKLSLKPSLSPFHPQ
jgi:hypothetical protein